MIPTSVSNAGVARWWHGVTFVVVAASLVLQLTSLVVTVVSWRWSGWWHSWTVRPHPPRSESRRHDSLR
jgi:hypothetical protein